MQPGPDELFITKNLLFYSMGTTMNDNKGTFDSYTFLVKTATFATEFLPHPFDSYEISSFN